MANVFKNRAPKELKHVMKTTVGYKVIDSTLGKNNTLRKAIDPTSDQHFDPLDLFKKPKADPLSPAPLLPVIADTQVSTAQRSVRRRALAGGIGSQVVAGNVSATGQQQTLLGG